MIYSELNIWISQSESWQAYIDFSVSAEAESYDFFERPDDFYISLLFQLKESLDQFNDTKAAKSELLSIAKGLEIYSLKNKKENFIGISYSRNILYVASLYFLADYPATSILLLKQFSENEYNSEIEKFIFYFLSRSFSVKEARDNYFFTHVYDFLREGDQSELDLLNDKIESELVLEQEKPYLYLLLFISKTILSRFYSNNLWSDLGEIGELENWKPFVRFNISKTPRVWNFFPSQKEALNRGLLSFERSFSLQTPTSSGKTSIAELVIFNELRINPESKILYLAPFRALASELKNNLGRNLSKLGIKIKTIYGGNIVTDYDRTSIELANVLISTPEKFMAIENGIQGTLSEFKVVICDEGHLIDDTSRGISYELLLSRLKITDITTRKFLFLSAIIPNIEVINSWLGGTDQDIAKSDYRPTEIELAFLEENQNSGFDLIVNPNDLLPKQYTVNNFLSSYDFEKNDVVDIPSTFKAKAATCGLKALNSGAVAIFAPTKDNKQGIRGIANEVLKRAGSNLPSPINFANKETVSLLQEYFLYIFSKDYILYSSILNGFLFHHGDLPQFIREVIEDVVRQEKIRLLICTTTIAEGVNLPIKTLIISSARRFNGSTTVPLHKRNLKNLIGRTGRAGKESKGTVIVVNEKDRRILSDVISNTNLEEVKGFLFHVVKVIEGYVKKSGTILSNDLLDELEESNYIDDSIIQLLAEDIKGEQLDASIKNLVERTLTFYQADDNLKNTLNNLFLLRSEKVRPMIENGKINDIRNTGIPLRLFEEVEKLIDFDSDFISEIDNPLDQQWLDFIFDILSKMKTFYEDNKILAGVTAWMSGGWYKEVAIMLGISIDDTLEFFSRVINYEMQNDAASIIKYIQIKRAEKGLETSNTIVEWPNYLVYGLKSKIELDLTEMGIPDRILAIALANWIGANAILYTGQANLRFILAINQKAIIEDLKQAIPAFSHIGLVNFLRRPTEFE